MIKQNFFIVKEEQFSIAFKEFCFIKPYEKFIFQDILKSESHQF